MALLAKLSQRRRAATRRRRSSGRVKGRSGARIQAPNLEQAYLLAGLATGSASDQAWQQAHGGVAHAISAAKQAGPEVDNLAVDATPDQLIELLVAQRNEARRRYAEEQCRGPGSTSALRAKQAADALDAALSRAVDLQGQRVRRERDPQQRRTRRVRKLIPRPVDREAEATRPGQLPRELGSVGRRAGSALRRGVHSTPTFKLSGDIVAQAGTTTPEQLRDTRDALRDATGEYGAAADIAIAAAETQITGELVAKEAAEREADSYARRHYGVTANQLGERDTLQPERLGRNAHDPGAARREVDNVIEQENIAPGWQPTMRQTERPGPTAVASAGRPPDRARGMGPRSQRERIVAQSVIAQGIQDDRRARRVA